MKIEWMDDDREIPGHGLFESGKIYTVPEDVGKSFVNQNQAKEVSEVIVPKESGSDREKVRKKK